MERTYDVDVRLMVRARTRAEAIEKAKKIRMPRGVSFTWVQQARYTDAHTADEMELNVLWTTHVPKD